MLIYDKLFVLLDERGIKKSALRNYGFAPRIPSKLARSEDVSTDTINRLCKLLDCQPSDIMEYVPDNAEE